MRSPATGSKPVNKCAADTDGAVYIEGGAFLFGTENAYSEEAPVQRVVVEPFWIDKAEVSVERFRDFVAATGYVTVAERPLDPSLYPGADPALLVPGGAVFRSPQNADLSNYLNWWAYEPGADWRTPQGVDAGAAASREPVTQIAFEDAEAFAEWAGGRLPLETEWEFAALAGGDDPSEPTAAPTNANTWQGVFPLINSAEDGFAGVAPTGCYAPNAYGLYDMLGNVWEWTADWYTPRHVERVDGSPRGASAADMHDPNNPGLPSRVVKGGSYLCAPSYCLRYRPSARQAQDTGLGTNHIGFRVVYDKEPEGWR